MKKKDYNNNQSYLEYLIYEKDILKPKNLMAGVVAIFVCSALIFGALKAFNSYIEPLGGDETFTMELMIETLISHGYNEEELKTMDEDKIISLFNKVFLNNKNQTSGKPGASEYPETQSRTLKQDYYIMASKGNFDKIVSDFENKKMEYSFEHQYNKELITIYNDAYYLKTISKSEDNPDFYLASQVLKNIKDPQMLLYGILFAPEESRRDIIKDKISLSPLIFEENIKINSISSGSLLSASNNETLKNDNRFKEVARYIGEGDFIIYKFDFTIDKNNLHAYIYKNMDTLEINFYGMYEAPNSPPSYYITVLDWINMGANNNNLPQQEGNDNIEDNSNNEDIPSDDSNSDDSSESPIENNDEQIDDSEMNWD